jgi:hypothetical protein
MKGQHRLFEKIDARGKTPESWARRKLHTPWIAVFYLANRRLHLPASKFHP